MKTFFRKLVLLPAGMLIVLCCCRAGAEQAVAEKVDKSKAIETKQTETKAAAVGQRAKEEPTVKKPAEQPNIVAEIGDYVITREELEDELVSELRPDRFESDMRTEPVDANAVLMRMVAEKAMVMEGRKRNYLKDGTTRSSLKRFKEEKLVRLLLQAQLQGKIIVTKSEIEEKMKANPKLDQARAEVMLKRLKGRQAVNQFYKELSKKLHVQKVRDNFSKAAQIHERLLHRPKEQRRGWWISNRQVRDDLTPEEKNIVLTTYDNGKVTLEDWLDALCQYSPPSRPKDLGTINGVERLLDSVMMTPIFVAEAKSLGLDRDENFLKQVRNREDQILLGKFRREMFKDLKKPTKEEMADYFNKHKEEFMSPDTLKVAQIWCEDLKTAQEVKKELSAGKDFESVREQYSLKKKEQPFSTSARKEGIFFEDLWKGEPNEVAGPVKGFYDDEVKWRIVKILDKKPGKMREYSSGVEREVSNRMRQEERGAILDKYRKELLNKYSYKIYTERIKNIGPLNIP